jgi:hypothetical protein
MMDANGLVYLRARYYHPGLGVFPSLDPVENGNRYQYVNGNPINDAVGEPMSLNRYSYVAGNPTNVVDPSGMIMETPEKWNSCRQQRDTKCVKCCVHQLLVEPVAFEQCYAACINGGETLNYICSGCQMDSETQLRWNLHPYDEANNCYSYAIDDRRSDPEISGLNPGMRAGIEEYIEHEQEATRRGLVGCEHMQFMLESDGLRKVADPTECLTCNGWAMYLVLSSKDYHFYRQHQDNTWSSKQGASPVTRCDASGNIIRNPEEANHDYRVFMRLRTNGPLLEVGGENYTVPCGYYCVCP